MPCPCQSCAHISDVALYAPNVGAKLVQMQNSHATGPCKWLSIIIADAFAAASLPVAPDLCRHAGNHCVFGHIPRHDSASGNHCSLADSHTWQDHCVSANPDIVGDVHTRSGKVVRLIPHERAAHCAMIGIYD